jgi:acyl-CoA synthetase (AMP-forming)/AMP-acid ligase II
MNLTREVNTIADLPLTVSVQHAKKTALIADGRCVSYRELDLRSNQIANALIRHGIVPGDRVAMLTKESLESLELIFGVAKINAVLVNLNWRLAADEIAYILGDAGAKLVFIGSEFMTSMALISEKLPSPPKIVALSADGSNHSLSEWCAAEGDMALQLEHHPHDVVVQIYTSGTTGYPKGVLLPNSSFFAIAKAMEACGDRWINWTDETVSLLFVPTFHIGGLWWLIHGLSLGSTNVVLRGFEPAAILRAIGEHQVNKTCMVPAMMQVLLAEPASRRTNFHSLDTIVYGGSPMSPQLLKRAMTVFGCDFCQIYGMTETGNMAVSLRPCFHKQEDDPRLCSVGKPLPGVEVRVLDAQRKPVEAGEVGEIAIKSAARMQGYWGLREATEAVMSDGWIMTGDAGYQDRDGFIYLCDRIKDMILCAGENIYPAEIETVLRRHPGVMEVAVIGIPDNLWGEVVKAVVVRAPGATIDAAAVIRHARGHLAEFKVPRSVEFIDQLPRNASGKILKAQLREPYWKQRERRIN